MANVHVLTRDGNHTNVVVHVPVPAGNNSVSVPWRTALVRSGIGGTTVLPDGDGTAGTISAAEKTAITAGSIYEVMVAIKNADLTQSGLDTLFAKTQAEVQSTVAHRLQFYGGTR